MGAAPPLAAQPETSLREDDLAFQILILVGNLLDLTRLRELGDRLVELGPELGILLADSTAHAFAQDLLENFHLLAFDAEPLVPLIEKVSSLETLIGPAADAEQVNGRIDEFLREVDLLIVEAE